MSVYRLRGTIGAGKSYHVMTTWIIPAVQQRRKIFTSVEGINVREISFVTGVPVCEIDITYIDDKKEWERLLSLDMADKDYSAMRKNGLWGALCVVDEAQCFWLNRDYKATPYGFIWFMTKCRHFDCDLVFTTQAEAQMDVAISRLVAVDYLVLSQKHWGKIQKNKYRVEVRIGGEVKQPAWNSETYTLDAKYYRTYESAKSFHFDSQMQFKIPSLVWKAGITLVVALFLMARSWKYNPLRGNIFVKEKTHVQNVEVKPQSPVDLPGLARPSAVPKHDDGPVIKSPSVAVGSSVAPSGCTVEVRGGCYQIGDSPRICDYRPTRVCDGVPQYVGSSTIESHVGRREVNADRPIQ